MRAGVRKTDRHRAGDRQEQRHQHGSTERGPEACLQGEEGHSQEDNREHLGGSHSQSPGHHRVALMSPWDLCTQGQAEVAVTLFAPPLPARCQAPSLVPGRIMSACWDLTWPFHPAAQARSCPDGVEAWACGHASQSTSNDDS